MYIYSYLHKVYTFLYKIYKEKIYNENIVYGKFRAFNLEAEIEKIMRQIEQ